MKKQGYEDDSRGCLVWAAIILLFIALSCTPRFIQYKAVMTDKGPVRIGAITKYQPKGDTITVIARK